MQTSDYPLAEERVEVVYRPTRVRSWHGQQSLMGAGVAVVRGFGLEMHLEVEIKPFYVNDYDQALRVLLAGRVKFVLGEQLLTGKILLKYLEDGHKLSRQLVYFRLNYVGFVRSERGGQLLKLYEERMAKLLSGGELHAIYRKWERKMPPMPTTP
nr:transporter substrate-binding domain-containing protein [Aestuariicella albida]